MSGMPPCEKHPDKQPVAICPVCGKTVCTECFKNFGYFCSAECRDYQKANSAISEEEKQELAEMQKQEERANIILPWIMKKIPLGLLSLLVLYILLRVMDSSGDEKWQVSAPSSGYACIAGEKDSVYTVRSDGVCQTLSSKTGAEKWQSKVKEGFGWGAGMILTNGHLLIIGPYRVEVLNASDGTSLWTLERSFSRGDVDMAFNSRGVLIPGIQADKDKENAQPASVTNMFNSISDTSDGAVAFIDMKSGRSLWAKDYYPRTVKKVLAGENFCVCVSCKPGGFEMVPCEKHKNASRMTMIQCKSCKYERIDDSDFQMEVLNASDGECRWPLKLKGGVIEDVYLIGDSIILLTRQKLYCIDRAGKEIWKRDLSDIPRGICVTDVGKVVLASSDRLIAIASDNGTEQWSTECSGHILEMIANGGSVYVRILAPKAVSESASAADAQRPLLPQQQMMKEIVGDMGGESEGEGFNIWQNTEAVLVKYDISSGNKKWDMKRMSGELTFGEGVFYIMAQPLGLVTLTSGKTETYITCHALSDAKKLWQHKIEAYASDLALTDNSVVIIATHRSGSGFSITSGVSEESIIHALKRRGLINRITKF